jgi:hypothetical protein
MEQQLRALILPHLLLVGSVAPQQLVWIPRLSLDSGMDWCSPPSAPNARPKLPPLPQVRPQELQMAAHPVMEHEPRL